ncbi:MAG: MBL fold metallo-hydrolase, partial [Gemmatimonas sp.]
MPDLTLRATYIGGPTALLEIAGLRLLTDPTFDPGGTEYRTPVYTLRKTDSPAVAPDSLGPIDAVLLSHDHHFDNLDHAGRDLLSHVPLVLTTPIGAERLGGNARGLVPRAVIVPL